MSVLPDGERPAYVGTFHGLGLSWGAPTKGDDESAYWEQELPTPMVELAGRRPPGDLFDAIVVDEGQDFADLWWPGVLVSLKDRDHGGLFVFSDEGQRCSLAMAAHRSTCSQSS